MATEQQLVVTNRTNGLGTAGLILAILGWFTCGLLCIPAVVVSLLGLLFRPRGNAIAGLVVAFPGSLFFLFVGFGLLASLAGMSAALQDNSLPPASPTYQLPIDHASSEEKTLDTEHNAETSLASESIEAPLEPTLAPPTPKLEPTPAPPIVREFTDATGQFRVKARVVSIAGDTITLERVDNAKKITITIAKLSGADQDWIAATRPAVDSGQPVE